MIYGFMHCVSGLQYYLPSLTVCSDNVFTRITHKQAVPTPRLISHSVIRYLLRSQTEPDTLEGQRRPRRRYNGGGKSHVT